jgi:hypothetical protein
MIIILGLMAGHSVSIQAFSSAAHRSSPVVQVGSAHRRRYSPDCASAKRNRPRITDGDRFFALLNRPP